MKCPICQRELSEEEHKPDCEIGKEFKLWDSVN